MTQELPLPEVTAKGSRWFGRLEPTLTRDYSPHAFVAIDVLTGEYAASAKHRRCDADASPAVSDLATISAMH